MKFFEAVPSELFSPLASPNRILYADALDVLYAAYQENLKIREDVLYSMLRGRLEQELADATFEDEDIDEEELRDISGRARFLIRKLCSKGWFEKERGDDFEEYITIPNYSSRLLELFHQLCDDSPARGYSYVFGTFSVLKTADDSNNAYDIDDNTGTLVSCGLLPVKQVFTTYSKIYYDKRPIPDEQRTGILAGLNGLEKVGGKQRNKPATAPDIMGYMVAHSSGFDNPDLDSSLLIAARYDGNGFFLRKDNYLEKLPMFCASRYITYNRAWTERARIMKSADGADRYNADVASGKLAQFLLKCLLFTCTEMQNHMRTFTGSDGRFYRDELCLDGTNGKTIALRDIKGLIPGDREKAILNQWETVLQWAKKAENYSPSLTYGVYQIYAELDTSHVDETTGNTIWDNVELHTALAGLKTLVKDYYNSEIVPVLFEYEFIK